MLLHGTTFRIEEFVPPETMRRWGDRSVWFTRVGVILFAQWLKDYSGGIVTINDWYYGGNYRYSGYRPPGCLVGAKESSHRRCDAIDVRVSTMGVGEVELLIREKFSFLNSEFGYTGIEIGTSSWTHHDFRYTGMDHLHEIPFK